jgi:(R,R)-butanediol dehydrogenase/meso-butanediol dehydrogenase/diacetyl reductase
MGVTQLQAVFPGDRQVAVREREKPTAGVDEVVIRVGAAGVCGSDLHYLYRVPAAERGLPRLGVSINADAVPGHEPAGTVESVGSAVDGVRPGDRVVVHHISGCGHCEWCVSDRQMHCADKKTYGFDIDGAFQEFMRAKARDLVPVPDGLSMAAAAFCACGAGTAYNAVRKLAVVADDRLVVTGLGPVGLAAAQFALARGARVLAVDVAEERRKIALTLGVKLALDPTADDFAAQASAWSGGRGATAGVDCSGNESARGTLLDAMGVGGRVAFVGEGGAVTLSVSEQVIHKQLTIIGSWIFGRTELREAMEFVAERGIALESLITDRYSFDDVASACATADRGVGGKVVVIREEENR